MAADKHASVPKPLATGDASEWFIRFEICSKANEWDNAKMALKLPTLMEGEALAVWLDIAEGEQADYKVVKEKVVEKMKPMGFVALEEFHKRKMQPGEAVTTFSYNLKKLLNQAMTNLDPAAREQVLLHQFLAGLPPSVSRQIRATVEARELEQTVKHARLLMAISEQEHTAAIPEDPSELQQLRKQVQNLTEHVAALTTQRHDERKQQPYRCCFKCNQPGHLQRNCT